MPTIGIDFGTSNSCASYVNSNGEVETIRFIQHEHKMPSIVSMYPDGKTPLVGFNAFDLLDSINELPQEEQARLFLLTEKSIKSRLKPDGHTYSGLSHTEIVSLIISKIKKEAERSCSPTIFDGLTITHPVQFEEWKKDILKDAARKSGFSKITLLEEPISAAVGYIRKENLKDIKAVLVYDFGAGTFDTAYVVKQGENIIIPLVPQGDSKCGGDDIDEALYKLILKKSGYSPQNRDLHLLMRCKKWKEILSDQTSVPINLPAKKIHFILTREEFEECISNIVERTIDLTYKVYSEIKENRLPLDFILMIGGSSNIPLITSRLKQRMPDVDIRTSGISDVAVALGASYHNIKPVKIDPEKEWCQCMNCNKKILKSYNFCIYCGTPNAHKKN